MSVGAVNKNTGDRIPTAGMPAIDDALDLTSVNPVQNAVITAALANKQDKTDNALQTTDKTVVGAINEHEGDIGSLKSGLTNINVALSVPDGSGKNVLPITVNGIKALNTSGTWDGNDYAINGITYTIVTDASGNITSITADGTSTDRARLYLTYGNNSKFSNMILSGCSNGESNYGIVIQMSSNPWTIYATNRDGDTTISTISSSDSNIFIEIANGKTVENIAFYPMIRDARITDATYTPYIPSVESRIEAVESGLTDVSSNITTINNKITGTFSTTGLTTTGCQIMDGGYAKIGNLVFVQVLIKATSDTSFTISKFPKGVGTIQESQYPPRIVADDSEFLFCQFLSDGMQIFTFGQAPVIDKLYKLSCLYLAQ